MARTGIMIVAGALALLVLFGFFYVAGIAIGAVVIPIAVLVLIALAVWGVVKMRGSF